MTRQLNPPSSDIAPLWRRLGAMIYDGVVLIGLWIFVTFLVTAAFGIDEARSVDGNVVILNPYYRVAVMASVIGTAWLFFSWFWTFSGQTLGMQAWKIRVQNRDNSAISWQQATLRCLTAPLALGALAIGYLWMFGDKEQRTWPDMLSRSVVVRVRNFAELPR